MTPEDRELLERLKAHAVALRAAADEIADSEATKAAVLSAADAIFAVIRPALVALAAGATPVGGVVVDRVSAAVSAELHRRAKLVG